jgi:hypothetical protein
MTKQTLQLHQITWMWTKIQIYAKTLPETARKVARLEKRKLVGLNRQKYLPRPMTDRWLGIARIQNREKRAKNEVRSKR